MRPGPALGARLWWGLPVVLVAVWVGGALVVAAIPGLPVAPAVTTWVLPAARFARDVSSMVTVGALVVGGLLLASPSARARRWAVGWAIAWLVSLVALFALTLSDIRAVSIADVVDPTRAWSFLSVEAIGHVFLWQFVAVAVAVVLAAAGSSPWSRWLAVVLAVGASAAPAFLGHADVMDGHVGATASLALHIAAVSVWVGGLAVTVGLLRIDGGLAPELAPRFSLLALWCVIVVAETGLLNASLRVGTASAMVATTYGALVIAKALLLGALVRLGWLQRQRSLADLDTRPAASVASLVRIASWEFVAMGAAVGVSVALSRVGPGPSGLASAAFSPLAVCCLALAAPLLLAWCWTPDQESAWVRRLRAYPEIWAVVLLFLVIEVAGVGIVSATLGPDAGAVVGSVALLLAGSVWALAAAGGRGTGSVIVMLAGWPLVGWVVFALTDGASGWRSALVSVVIGEALLVLLLRSGRQRVTAASRPAPAPAAAGMGGSAHHD